ncbi:myosin-1 [Paracoccidioides brasiliensis Pb18]|uniref:Myosin-1 n=1 Tax=Paracoccidioides brasiliensis (strain Pb18) TaxID=502780 RepID=C1G766_PARBD|nr:myosin-1 [Paracoccidioides brasiliensis Pb18]EEH46923.2 myosin-1 [Paracoccidioides brasiliensis Pb18]
MLLYSDTTTRSFSEHRSSNSPLGLIDGMELKGIDDGLVFSKWNIRLYSEPSPRANQRTALAWAAGTSNLTRNIFRVSYPQLQPKVQPSTVQRRIGKAPSPRRIELQHPVRQEMSITLKLSSLVIRTLSKPIANQIKAQAREHERFRRVCVSFAQAIHRVDMRMRLGLLQSSAALDKQAARETAQSQAKKHKPQVATVKTEAQIKLEESLAAKEKEKAQEPPKPPPPLRIRPLSEAKAIDSGATFISETFLFIVAGSLIVFEALRSRRKETSRREDVADRLAELEESEQAARRGLVALEREVLQLKAKLEKQSPKNMQRILPKDVWNVEEAEAETEELGWKSRLVHYFRISKLEEINDIHARGSKKPVASDDFSAGHSRRPRDTEKKGRGFGRSRHAEGGAVGKPQVKKAVFESTKKKEVGVSDLTLLSKVSNEAINENLKKRFEHGEIYTYIGHVLVSVNPFRDLGIYTDQVLDSYRGKNRLEVPPHVFAVAESAYYNMNAYKENQCVIISGESGAGKTEAAKRLMQYIANVSGGSDSSIQHTKDMVLATNPLLESFGNAKTLRNNNSSRFGKYLELQFNSVGEPVGATITNYLLEKSRVVGQITNERNFHIFYQFTKAAPQAYRDNFGIQQPQSYVYTSRSKCFDVSGIDDAMDFKDTLEAMRIIGLSQAEQDNIFRILSAILWLGNMQFVEDDSSNASITDQSVVDFVAYLLEVDSAQVSKALTLRILETARGGRRGSVYEVPLNTVQATAVRDALAKALYFNLFDWIVERVNASLAARGSVANSIGILDIYGFEIFDKNSFEQLCINYVNEKLQQIFIQLTLKTEQEEYAREQIKWTPITYFDNKVVCSLIEDKRPPGIFAALNDACATAHADSGAADQTFVGRLNFLSQNPNFESRQGQFIVKHYAGDVGYTVKGMTDKNKDQLLKDLLNLVGSSSNSFVHTLFPDQVNQDDKRRPPTAGDKIKASANDLVATLMKAQPSYIRTIKPNDNKSPSEYNVGNVMHQIKYLGLQENVRIRRAGFAYRQTFDKFVERFYLLSPKTSYAGDYTWTGDAESGARQILKDTSIPAEEYQMGTTKAFIKTPETIFALEHMRDRYWHNMAIRIQRAWRNYLRYRIECAIRIQRFWRRVTGGLEYIKLRDQGHKILGGMKERRRYSLVGSRRFLGDYLGVGNTGGPGEMIRDSVRIGKSETVLFSCRCELLVTKFGRSSKPAPRILILTSHNVYIVVQSVVNHQLNISAERTISVGAIKFVSASKLKDDWFALGVGAAQEPDPLINCVFKTEFFTYLSNALHGQLNLKLADVIEYNKKPGKLAIVKTMKDPAIARDDIYKSGTIHTSQGEPPNSVSRPTPRPKQVAGKPITKGKLLRPGGPGGGPSKLASRPAASRPTPAAQPLPHAIAQPATTTSRPVPQPVATVSASHNRTNSAQARAPPPPPPPPPAAPPAAKKDTAKVLYDFNSERTNELSIRVGEIVQIMAKEGNGWWLCMNTTTSAQGWAPEAYLEEIVAPTPAAAPPLPPPPPSAPRAATISNSNNNNNNPVNPITTNGASRAAAKAKPTPPAPPAKRPVAGRKPAAPATPRDSAVSMNSQDSPGGSGRATPNSMNNFAGGLAEALRQRQSAMKPQDDDDW